MDSLCVYSCLAHFAHRTSECIVSGQKDKLELPSLYLHIFLFLEIYFQDANAQELHDCWGTGNMTVGGNGSKCFKITFPTPFFFFFTPLFGFSDKPEDLDLVKNDIDEVYVLFCF